MERSNFLHIFQIQTHGIFFILNFGASLTFCNIRKKVKGKGKGKAVPLQSWSGPEGSRKLRFSDFMITARDGGKVFSLTHGPPLPPGNTPGAHFS
jgi:hypothetical protein